MATILVVDDDPDFVEVIRTVLQKEGHEITTASNGDQALKVMKDSPPDLLLLDVMMSYVLDGLNVVREMRADPKLKDIPIIIISSLTGVQTEEMYPSDRDMEIEGWISKPVQPKELIDKVNALIGAQESS